MESKNTATLTIINSPYTASLQIPKVEPSFRELSEHLSVLFEVPSFKLLYIDEEMDWITVGTDLEL